MLYHDLPCDASAHVLDWSARRRSHDVKNGMAGGGGVGWGGYSGYPPRPRHGSPSRGICGAAHTDSTPRPSS